MINPEFRRNLWQAGSPQQLIAPPVILGLLFTAAYLVGEVEALRRLPVAVMYLLLILWGTRAAADAVLGEVAAGTWDGQRLSALGPWTMTLGKLFGAPILVWYSAAWCIPALLVDPPAWQAGGAALTALLVDAGHQLVWIVLAGLFAHALALLLSMLMLRMQGRKVRAQVGISQVLAVVGGYVVVAGSQGTSYVDTLTMGVPQLRANWYGLGMATDDFAMASTAVFMLWLIIGIHRLMRAELQFRNGPLVWLAFVVFCAGYVGGFVNQLAVFFAFTSGFWQLRLWLAVIVILALTVAAAFFEPKSVVRLRRWLGIGGGARRLAEPPGWFASYVLGLAVMAVLAGWLFRDHDAAAGPVTQMLVGWHLFVLRDVGLLYVLNLDPARRGRHILALVYLAVLYLVIPVALQRAGGAAVLPAFWPSATAHPAAAILLPLLEAAVLWFWVFREAERLSPRMGPAPVPARA